MGREPRMGAGEFDAAISAAQAGGTWALEQLYRAYSGAVLGYLRVQGLPDPEDTTSEVFISAFRTLATFSGDEAQFRAWLFTIAHRRLVDVRRAIARRPEMPIADYAGVEPQTEHVLDDVERALATERVRALCEDLVPDQRTVLLLRLIGGLTIDEIAVVMGKSRGAVKALQRRGLSTLRRRIEHEGVPL